MAESRGVFARVFGGGLAGGLVGGTFGGPIGAVVGAGVGVISAIAGSEDGEKNADDKKNTNTDKQDTPTNEQNVPEQTVRLETEHQEQRQILESPRHHEQKARHKRNVGQKAKHQKQQLPAAPRYYYQKVNTVTADLSAKISPSSPSIDKLVSYGLAIDAVHHQGVVFPNSSSKLVDIKLHTVDDDDDDQECFSKEMKISSAVYTISIQSETIADQIFPRRTLKIRHCANPNNPEELKNLRFVKASSDSSGKFEVVPGGIFKPGKQYGEITFRSLPTTCSWAIVNTSKKAEGSEVLYTGTLLYQAVKHHPNQWLMQLLVAEHTPASFLALTEYIKNRCGHNVVRETEFLFSFEKRVRPKLSLMIIGENEETQFVYKCKNGWEISFDMHEMSKDTVDHFKKHTDIPGRCSLIIHTHMNVCHEMAQLPTVTLNGITSDKKHIIINPPNPGAEFEKDYTNDKPQLKNVDWDSAPTLKAVFNLLKRNSARWNDFGKALGISQNDRQILYDERISAEARLERVIHLWMESQCSPTTWDNLINVLREMGLQDIVDVIRESQMTCLPTNPRLKPAFDIIDDS